MRALAPCPTPRRPPGAGPGGGGRVSPAHIKARRDRRPQTAPATNDGSGCGARGPGAGVAEGRRSGRRRHRDAPARDRDRIGKGHADAGGKDPPTPPTKHRGRTPGASDDRNPPVRLFCTGKHLGWAEEGGTRGRRRGLTRVRAFPQEERPRRGDRRRPLRGPLPARRGGEPLWSSGTFSGWPTFPQALLRLV